MLGQGSGERVCLVVLVSGGLRAAAYIRKVDRCQGVELVGVTRVAEARRSFHGLVAAGLWGPVGSGVGVV